jgi:hypothetical protein
MENNMDNYDRSKLNRRMLISGMYALAMSLNSNASSDNIIPSLPYPKPIGYGVHLSKAERKGKTREELQKMREEKIGE